jgi:hypothetical protein
MPLDPLRSFPAGNLTDADTDRAAEGAVFG